MAEPSASPNSLTGPVLRCPALSAFDATRWESVAAAFANAPGCALRQAWQPAASPGFAPAVVRVGWRGNVFLVFAELTDRDIHTHSSELNQRLWELGDAFEIFLRPSGQSAYVELQVAPNNHRLQLRYADTAMLDRARQTGSLTEALIPSEVFGSRTWVDAAAGRWHVLAEIPARLVSSRDGPLAGARWHFSFSRYDYTRGKIEPVISSTSPHAEANFHRQQEWGELHFLAAGTPTSA